jgi:hypothetical protein
MPQAEPAVSAWRSQLDPMAALGVPAHLTVLFPFVPPAGIDEATRTTLRELLSSVTTFDFSLVATRWFADTVVWLAPDPDAPFRVLTQAVADAFPAYPPYGGQFPDPVPHLTIADRGPPEAMHAAEQQLQRALPIRSIAGSVTLLTELPTGRWDQTATFFLRPR